MDFSNAKPGNLPPHWIGTQTGNGQAKWSIEKDAESPGKPNVLKQSGEATFPSASRTTPASRTALSR